MFKFRAHASSRPVAHTKNGNTLKDGWGHDRQTIYLKKNANKSFQDEEYRNIARHQEDFCDLLESILKQDPNYFPAKLERIYNDPTAYSVEDIVNDIRQHYKKKHDPTLSMILRQRYIIRRLAEQLQDPTIISRWGIDIDFYNPSAPVLRKFYDKGVFDQDPTNNYDNLFE